jgi:hypothetical protein
MPTSSGFTPLGAERAATADRENRRIEKSDDDAAVLDLVDERRRRSGNAA